MTFPWFAVLLILAGVVLLLDKLEIVEFGFHRVLSSGLIALGLTMTVQGFTVRRSGRIFWGTTAFLYGVYFLLRTFHWPEFHSSLFLPASLLVIGTAMFMTYLANFQEWFLLVASLLFLGLGSAVLMGQLEVYDVWQVWWSIRRYWPALLILAGLGLIVRSMRSPGRT